MNIFFNLFQSRFVFQIEDLETGESLGPGEEGEVCVKVKHIMLGYVKNPEATSATFDEDGWFHTGDIGYYDEDGYLYIIDRIKDLIKYKSYQVIILRYNKIK